MNVSVRGLWLVIFVLISVMVGLLAALITWLAEHDLLAAAFNGAGAFAATMFLLFAAFAFLGDARQ